MSMTNRNNAAQTADNAPVAEEARPVATLERADETIRRIEAALTAIPDAVGVESGLRTLAALGYTWHGGMQWTPPDAAPQASEAVRPALAVWYGSMPESNGKSNWTAILHRKGDGLMDGPHITIDRSEYPDRVRYEADRLRFLIGEIDKEPWILDYDADKCDAPQADKDAGDCVKGVGDERLLTAARGMTKLYPHVWDRSDGHLVVFPENVAQFDAAFDALRCALGEAVVDDFAAQPTTEEKDMTENNAVQAITEKLWRSCVTAASLAPTTGSVVVESSTILAIDNVLSALRAEGMQAGEPESLRKAVEIVDTLESAAAEWGGWSGTKSACGRLRHILVHSALAWNQRNKDFAALASAPVADAGNWQQYRLQGSNETAEQIIERERTAYAGLLQSVMDKRRALASAPVAGEVVAWRVTHPRWPQPGWRDASCEPAPSLNELKQQDADLALELAYAAPRASEAVRIVFPAHLRKMWSGGEVQAWLDEHQGITPPKASARGSMKRYRKWQADRAQTNKVGVECSKGAGEASSPVAGVPHTALQLEDLSRQVERDIHRFGTNVHVGVPAGVLRSMLCSLHDPVAGEARKMLADEEALEGVAEWLKQHDLTVNVGAAIEPDQDVRIESSAGWLLRLLTALNSAPHAIEAATAAARASALQFQRKEA
ncbi:MULTISPECIES: hypothetical protein [Achromobacter]|uniref:hypothetical protein n=1 Tax=Achromobacter TaxID=222 RepID=UPI0023F93FC3|nr:hypothetical protein [Achromobacter anxifer]MDF8363319.1 hypothetical protein [Achromobacter anxifer]